MIKRAFNLELNAGDRLGLCLIQAEAQSVKFTFTLSKRVRTAAWGT